METVGVATDNPIQQTMTEQTNSSNSTHERIEPTGPPSTLGPPQAEQPVVPDQEESDQRPFIPNGSDGSNPSGERGSNPSQRADESIEALRIKIYESQATNEAFRK